MTKGETAKGLDTFSAASHGFTEIALGKSKSELLL